ncbi:hypothetical protein A2380_02820 [candidate division WWE3 bacterium RIFOXYB1_FULL_43_24]|uniref:Uncharacterized protein n=2 Tax=Katanobacteria TaxID=422282 RepID=A0A0G1BK31_UNCKA|nr:MAG: hypothetical protein UU92_C0007G0049 [candidate division WWE3 bacterium GW2011_GWA1_42_12]KKS34726.1 MAG: hypothetical protein UU97_C0007G0016 [candidate division WWE3 bacterium GW2011_GWD1_42_14]KKS37833.1 MAG: hypothetical protein UV00_C0011G0016 [candidate division WWE3 bacterium GW2011_GWF1_42_14]KKS40199.1 MAG: hypothetical protein UV03_C0010G0016 [candidate division WWE3 bacterium GW2011_GWE1_42_16]KKS66192.1 MAG: hypothetical protein UV35_C0023G0020 [candidate division WWE3 bacte
MKLKVSTKILTTLGIFIITTGRTAIYAWDDCPKGTVNDPYPGDCVRYIDTDNNGICDHSEPAPEKRTATNNAAPTEGSLKNGGQVVSEKILADTPQNQLTETEPISKTPDKKIKTLLPKLLTAVAIVLFHLIGILLYTNYRKAVVRNR